MRLICMACIARQYWYLTPLFLLYLSVAVSRAGAGGTHGWARVALADGAAAAEATKRLDGQLVRRLRMHACTHKQAGILND